MTEQKPNMIHTELDASVAENTDLDTINDEKLSGEITANLRLDKHGLPLVPQPTIHKDDPLVGLFPSIEHVRFMLTVL